MKEKDFQSLFSAWVGQNKLRVKELCGNSAAFELKISKGSSIRFDALREHQDKALNEVRGEEGCYHKINDMPFIKDNLKYRFTNKKPFDCFYISDSNAYVVIFFYKKGQRSNEREIIFVGIRSWDDLWSKAEENGKKSISEKLLREVGHIEKLIVNK